MTEHEQTQLKNIKKIICPEKNDTNLISYDMAARYL